MSKPGGDPCMGLFLSRSFGWAAHFFPSSVSLFDLKARLRPDPRVDTSARAGAVKVGRRTNLAACSAFARPHLDRFEHDGTLGAIGMTIRGEPACGRDQSRHNLVFGGANEPNHESVKRTGSEAPKRRTHSSSGMTAMSHLGTPPPRTVIGDPSQRTDWAETVGCLQRPPFIVPDARTMPSGTMPSRTSRHRAIRSLRAK